jgi:hypothetical protein
MDSRAILARFETERQVQAILHHDNIGPHCAAASAGMLRRLLQMDGAPEAYLDQEIQQLLTEPGRRAGSLRKPDTENGPL